MGIFDMIKNFTGKLAPIDIDKVVSLAKEGVTERALNELVGMAEDQAKEKLQEIAADEVEKQVANLLGDKASAVPDAVKKPAIDKATESVVEQVWDRIKEKLSGQPQQ